ncbi:hypothetical protein ACI783_13025, partial [Modestobacter sp. SYSU DS0511]
SAQARGGETVFAAERRLTWAGFDELAAGLAGRGLEGLRVFRGGYWGAAPAAGEQLPPVPAGLDGSTFRLTAGPGVAAIWSEARGLPALAVGRVNAPTAESSGVPFDVARDYLLSLPGLPDSLADQLRTFTADGTTLPLPVPAELATTSTTEVDGAEATVLASRDGLLHGVVWVADGIVTGVAGTISEDEVLDVARGLR